MNRDAGQSNLFASIKSVFTSNSIKQWLPSRGNVVFMLFITMCLVWAQTSGVFARNAVQQNTGYTRPFPYQGRLADSNGNPLTNTYPMIFRLYASDSDTAVPLWEENWSGPNSVKVSDGLFSVMLGSLTSIPESVITTNPNLWLGITVGADNEMKPRIQLGSVPYSHQAQTVADGSISSAKLQDLSVTTAKLSDGSVTMTKLDPTIIFVPNGSVNNAKLADGSVNSAKVADGSLSGADVADGALTGVDIADGTIGTVDLANGSVSRGKLGGDVSLVKIQSGRVYASDTTSSGYTLHISSSGQDIYYTVPVTFPQPFATPPEIMTAISRLDDESTTNTRIEVYAENITTTGFTMVFHKWHITKVYSVTASWIAYANQ